MKKIIEKIKKWLVKLLIKLIHNDYEVYSMTISNNNNETSKAILFGHNIFYSEFNYGSDEGVEVVNSYSSYEHILFESQAQTTIKSIQIISTSDNIKNKVIYHRIKCGWGVKVKIPIILNDYFGENQVQKNVIVIEKKIRINGNNYLEIPLEPKEKITLLFFGEKYFNNIESSKINTINNN